MTYTYRCQICRIHFDGPNEKPVCLRCGSRHTERLLQRGNKKIKREKFSGPFVEVGKKCKSCIYFESIPVAINRCVCDKPETTFHKKERVWVCYSFKAKK